MVPSRFVNVEQAQLHFGVERVGLLAESLAVGDDLADEASRALAGLDAQERQRLLDALLANPDARELAPAAVRALAKAVHEVPVWLDRPRAERGAQVLVRAGVWGGMVLAFRSLIAGYCSPAGNKPLAFSGHLRESAPRRTAETARFFQAVCLPGGMEPGAPGFVASAKVRLMHAQVRRLLSKSPRWRQDEWGTPINQLDMQGTIFLFSLTAVEGLWKLGVPVSEAELEDVLHLWRYVGHVMGVRPELSCASAAEARVLWYAIQSTQKAPDQDSSALSQALIECPPPEGQMRVIPIQTAYGLSRFLLGDTLADQLGYPPRGKALTPQFVRAVVTGGSALLGWVPGSKGWMLKAGRAYWRRAVETGLQGRDATFEMPERVRHA